MSDSDTITRPVIVPDVDEETRVDERLDNGDEGDHDRFAHYVFGKNPGAMVTQAMVTGVPIKALCGKRWVPSRDGSKYPVCPDCQRIKDRMLRRGRGGGGGDDPGE